MKNPQAQRTRTDQLYGHTSRQDLFVQRSGGTVAGIPYIWKNCHRPL
jgi:hypothetical protein